MDEKIRFEDLCPTVREAGMQKGDFWQIPRRIYDHQLLLCLAGRAEISIDGDQCPLTPGSLAIIPPDTPHTVSYAQNPPAELAWLHCDFTVREDADWPYQWYNTPENYVKCFAEKLPWPEHIRAVPVFPGDFRLPHFVTFEEPDRMEMLFRTVIKAYAGDVSRFVLISRTAILQILDEVFTQCGYWKASAHPIRVSDSMKQYIRQNYMNCITLREIGAATQYNPDYAGKLFRRETGMTVSEYVNHVRIQKAQALLLDESIPVSEIAEKCGFQSVNYFSSVTRKNTGKSPRELRAHLLMLRGNVPGKEQIHDDV